MPEQVSPSTEKSSTPAADPAGSIVDDEAPNVTAALSPGTEMVTACVAVAKSLTVPKPTLAGAVGSAADSAEAAGPLAEA